jgi:hypothetical protein
MKYIFQPIVIFSDFFSNWDIRIILPNLYFLLLDAHNLLVELNWTEIPNPRWKGNDLHFNFVVWMYNEFVVGITG